MEIENIFKISTQVLLGKIAPIIGLGIPLRKNKRCSLNQLLEKPLSSESKDKNYEKEMCENEEKYAKC